MSRRSPLSVVAVLVLSLAAPSLARAGGLSTKLVRRGDQFGVRVTTADGAPFGASFQLFEPGSRRPWHEGPVPRGGFILFVPESAGTYYVRITDRTGRGTLVPVDVGEAFTPEQRASAPAPTPPEAPASVDPARAPRMALGTVAAAALVVALAAGAALRRRRAGRPAAP